MDNFLATPPAHDTCRVQHHSSTPMREGDWQNNDDLADQPFQSNGIPRMEGSILREPEKPVQQAYYKNDYSTSGKLSPYYENSQMLSPISHMDNLRLSSASPAMCSRINGSSHGFLPCVIPQRDKGNFLAGPFASPFIRAWPPAIESSGISKVQFIAFIDGLNDSFMANPVLQATNGLATLAGFVPLGTVQLASAGVSAAAGLGSAAMSITRTKLYFKETNVKLFGPRGLRAKMLTTRKMLEIVDAGNLTGSLELPRTGAVNNKSEDNVGNRYDPNSVIYRRMESLQGLVAPLDYNVPHRAAPEGMMNKMGAWQAQQAEKKAAKKWQKNQEESQKKLAKKAKERAKKEEKRAKKHDARAKKRADIDHKCVREGKLPKYHNSSSSTASDSSSSSHSDTEMANKAHEKEQKVTNKIRWVVITKETESERQKREQAVNGGEFGENDVEENEESQGKI